MVIAAMCPPGLAARGITSAASSPLEQTVTAPLEALGNFAADVSYEVAMPMSTDDIIYEIRLGATANDADTLAGMNYLIDWTLPRTESDTKGFLAYFNGHHYNYRDHRLREYHWEWDSIPFITATGGVQRNGQFVDLLPRSIARELRRMEADTTFTITLHADTLVGGRRVNVVDAVQTVRGFNGRNYRLVTDRATGLPLRISNEYNPTTISEQTVEVAYNYPTAASEAAVPATEEELISLYPGEFEKFRENNYRIENLRSLPLPGFSLPTTTAERYTRAKGDSFKAPTLIAIIDPQTQSARQTVSDLRKAVAQMPRQVDLILAFTGSNTDLVEEIAGTPDIGETMLISAKSLARDCGTSVFPTVIVARQDGTVDNVILGFNNNLTQDVIQMMALLP